MIDLIREHFRVHDSHANIVLEYFSIGIQNLSSLTRISASTSFVTLSSSSPYSKFRDTSRSSNGSPQTPQILPNALSSICGQSVGTHKSRSSYACCKDSTCDFALIYSIKIDRNEYTLGKVLNEVTKHNLE